MSDFLIRPAQESDAEEILAIYSPFIMNTAITFEETVPTINEMKDRIRKISSTHAWLVAVDPAANEVVGYVYGSSHRERAAYRYATEVSVYIAPRAQGRKLATRMYEELFKCLREIGYKLALAGVALPNEGSVRLHESLGFKPIGIYRKIGFKLGQWQDAGWWQLDLLPEVETPGELRLPKST